MEKEVKSQEEPRLKQADEPEAQEEAPKKKRTRKPKAAKLVSTADESLPEAEVEADYLRKYQYKKQTNPGSKESDPAGGSKAERMKRILLKQPKVRTMIPREGGEDPSIKQSVTLNG